MRKVSSCEARRHPSQLLDCVARGETVVVLRRGVPVARVLPAIEDVGPSVEDTIAALRAFRVGKRLNGIPVRELLGRG